jgi:hypothetical protein
MDEINLDNNSKIGVQFDQEKITTSSKVYVDITNNNKRSVLVSFLVKHGIIKEEKTAAWVIVCFAVVCFITALYFLVQAMQPNTINVARASKPVLPAPLTKTK